ncbi:hypothetical protein ACVNPZ_07735 [Staphylococcus aureus]
MIDTGLIAEEVEVLSHLMNLLFMMTTENLGIAYDRLWVQFNTDY